MPNPNLDFSDSDQAPQTTKGSLKTDQNQAQPNVRKPSINCEGKHGRFLQGSTRSFPGHASVIEYFQSGLSKLESPIKLENVALHFQGHTTTFQQLDDLSWRMAEILRGELGPDFNNENPDGDIVFGVCAPPTDHLIILLFAILKLGGAYVPFDISFPEDRVIKIVKTAKPVIIISDAHETTLSKFDPVKFRVKVITIDDLWTKAEAMRELYSVYTKPLVDKPSLWERTGIILFTSGSTGEPMGVRLTHRTILNRLNWQWHEFPYQANDSCCLKTALTFVDSVPEIFGPLLQGRQVVVFTKNNISNTHLFVNQVQHHNITRLTLVPSFLQSILTLMDIMDEKESKSKMFTSIRLWICSGETLTHELLMHFFKCFPSGATLCNFYGSTEVMGDVTWEVFQSESDVMNKCVGDRGAHVPIGQALFNSVVYILTPGLELTPEGEIGEIYVAGYNLASGYVGNPVSNRFIPNPFSKSPGFDRVFRTGDFGHIQLLPTGQRTLFYDGRLDSQIKVRGHRVDLSEIEETLNSLSLVKRCSVLCHRAGHHDQQIVAFVVPQDKLEGTSERITSILEMKLLPYQIPLVRILDTIPVLVNGKFDRQRLLFEYNEGLKHRSEFDDWHALDIPEENLPTFKIFTEIVAKVTGTSIQDIVHNLDDSFYNLGGTSLNSLTVIAELRKQNYYISIQDFVTAKTFREIAQLVQLGRHKKSDYRLHSVAGKTLISEALCDDHKKEAIHIISSSFGTKGDLDLYLNVSLTDYDQMLESVWKSLVDPGLSFVVRRTSDNKIIAVCLNLDANNEPTGFVLSPALTIIFQFLEHVEAPAREKLSKEPGKVLHSFMEGTHEDLTEAENVFVTEFMEEETLNIGRRRGFAVIFSTNTSALTQQIAIDIQGYTVLYDYQINKYHAADGTKPFEVAPDKQKVIACWKKIS